MLGVADTERFEMRISPELLAAIDAWRHKLPDNPPRATAVKRLIGMSLQAEARRTQDGRGGKMSERDYYVYALLREDGVTPFYIGASRDDGHISSKNPVVIEMLSRGVKPGLKIIKRQLSRIGEFHAGAGV
jgi:hypothetical protein